MPAGLGVLTTHTNTGIPNIITGVTTQEPIDIAVQLTLEERTKYSKLTSCFTDNAISQQIREDSVRELKDLQQTEPDKYFSFLGDFLIEVQKKTNPQSGDFTREDQKKLYEYYKQYYPGFESFVISIQNVDIAKSFPSSAEYIKQIELVLIKNKREKSFLFPELAIFLEEQIKSLTNVTRDSIIKELEEHDSKLQKLVKVVSALSMMLTDDPKDYQRAIGVRTAGTMGFSYKNLPEDGRENSKNLTIKNKLLAIQALRDRRLTTNLQI